MVEDNKEQIDHDRLFKELLQVFFIEFLELFFPEVLNYLDRDSLVFLDKEIFTDITSGEKHEVDLVVKTKFLARGAYFLVHIENQADNRVKFNRRMFRYFARLLDLHQLPVYPIAIFSYDEPKRAEMDSYQVLFPDFTVLSFNYRVVQLNRLNWRDFINKPNPVASALMAKMQVKTEDRPKVKAECLRLLVSLKLNPAKMKLISGFVDTYLKLSANEKQLFQKEVDQFFPQEKEPAMEIITSWMREGIEQGLQQGLQQGRQEGRQEGKRLGEVELILRLIKKRFGAIAPELQAKIEQLPTEKLEVLFDDLLDFKTKDELIVWLE